MMAEDGIGFQDDYKSTSNYKSSSFSMELERYCLKQKRLGRAYIFNNETFDDEDLRQREGTCKDANSMKALLEHIGFEEVEILQDLTQLKAIEKLDEISSGNFGDDSCFLSVFLSHGESDKIMMKKGKLHVEDDILTKFRGISCKSLSGKPKIFIIQACRGTKLEEAVWDHDKVDGIVTDAKTEEVEEDGVCSVTPSGADFVVCYAAANGYVSYRNTEDGSWFIQNFVRVMENYFKQTEKQLDFLSLMTLVADNVARKRDRGKDGKLKLQIPCVVSTLKKQLFLPKLAPKPSSYQPEDDQTSDDE